MLQEYAEKIKDKKIGFIGLGVSNLPILDALSYYGVHCTVRDKKDITNENSLKDIKKRNVSFYCGENYLNSINEDILFLAPAVRPDIPELKKAEENGAVLTSEMQEFFQYCPCKIIGVTGSDGKTTTTTLIAKLLEAEGYKVHLGGNIGKNLFSELDNINPEDYAVVELSSFQLFKMKKSPHIAVITNLAPNHLDWHQDMNEYAAAKQNIFRFQGKEDILILNKDDSYAISCAEIAPGKVKWISGTENIDNGFWFDKDGIHKGNDILYLEDQSIKIVGRHNRYNYSEAISATEGLVSQSTVKSLAETFGGVEHRIEFVREIAGVKFYNSSIDSSPSRTKACLESFPEPVIIICGGYDKHIPYEPLGPIFLNKVKYAVLCGATSDKIASVLDANGFSAYQKVTDFESAVKLAATKARSGDNVVLSPAAASFDLFKNFAERGNVFKEIVNKL